eukprot:754086-Hanusia_phi.AAC.9
MDLRDNVHHDRRFPKGRGHAEIAPECLRGLYCYKPSTPLDEYAGKLPEHLQSAMEEQESSVDSSEAPYESESSCDERRKFSFIGQDAFAAIQDKIKQLKDRGMPEKLEKEDRERVEQFLRWENNK